MITIIKTSQSCEQQHPAAVEVGWPTLIVDATASNTPTPPPQGIRVHIK